MNEGKLSFFSGSLLWFGAAISIAEIATGALLAPIGVGKGLVAVFAGHFIGCILLYFAGLLGAKTHLSAMETVGLSFGRYGSLFFSVLNILQLLGWTAVMIASGADAFGSAINTRIGIADNRLWCVLIGLLIMVWIAAGLKNIGKLNLFAVGALLILTLILGATVLSNPKAGTLAQTMSFGLALELSIAMPISWLPLIADYTKGTDRPIRFTLLSTACYFLGSSFMYIIGLCAAVFTGSADIVQILLHAGFGLVAMLIVILSTVTTTFLDVYSAGESTLNICPRWNQKHVGYIVCLMGILIALFVPMTQYENFLYWISSVFVPMAAILITDSLFGRHTGAQQKLNIPNFAVWLAGFAAYRWFLGMDTLLGSTIPAILLVMILSSIINIIKKAVIKNA